MSKLAEKTGNKVFVSNNKSWLDHFSAAGQGGVRVDWALVQTHTAPLSKQAIKNAIKQWGSNKWQLRWAKLAACQQAKVCFPAIKNVPAHFVRRLNRFDLSHVIHFTTGHNNLLRHRCKLAGGGSDVCRLCGVSKENALHLWTECSPTRDLGRGERARDPIKWSICQLSRFLREPTIAELLDHDRSEHPETCPGQPG